MPLVPRAPRCACRRADEERGGDAGRRTTISMRTTVIAGAVRMRLRFFAQRVSLRPRFCVTLFFSLTATHTPRPAAEEEAPF